MGWVGGTKKTVPLLSSLRGSCELPQHTPSAGPCREMAQVHRVQSGKVPPGNVCRVNEEPKAPRRKLGQSHTGPG